MKTLCPALLLLLLCLTLPAAAQSRFDAAYELKIRGITIGALLLSGLEEDGAYSAAGVIESTGAARIVRRFRYTGKAQGVLDGTRLIPDRYEESADTGRRQSEVILDYSNGVPTVTRYTSPRPAGTDSPDPATQGDTLDPLSTLYSLFRPRPASEICNETRILFDGKRRSQFSLGAPQAQGDRILCSGAYRRLQGYTPEEVARHVFFPMTVTFAPGSDGRMRPERIEIQTIYGPATVHRR